MNSSFCERRLHPDEEGSLQRVVRSQEAGTARLHWNTQNTQKLLYLYIQLLQKTLRMIQTGTHIYTCYGSDKTANISSESRKPTRVVLIAVKQINTLILSAGTVGQSQLLSNCQSSESSSWRSNGEMSKHVRSRDERKNQTNRTFTHKSAALRRNISFCLKAVIV